MYSITKVTGSHKKKIIISRISFSNEKKLLYSSSNTESQQKKVKYFIILFLKKENLLYSSDNWDSQKGHDIKEYSIKLMKLNSFTQATVSRKR